MRDILGVITLFLLALVCMILVAPTVEEMLTTDDGHEIIPPTRKALRTQYAAPLRTFKMRKTIDGETVH